MAVPRTFRRLKRGGLVAAIAAVLFGLATPASVGRADDVGDAKNKLNGDQQQQQQTNGIIDQLTAQIGQLSDHQTQLRAVIAQLQQRIARQQQVVALAQQRYDAISLDLVTAQQHLTLLRAQLARDTATLADQVRRIYEQGTLTTINALLSSRDFDQLWGHLVDQRRLATSEQNLVERVNVEQQQVSATVDQISRDRAAQADVLKTQRGAEQQLEANQAAERQVQAELARTIAADRVALAQNEQAQKDIAAEIEKDRKKLAAAIAAQQGGALMWPLQAEITQGFGCSPYAFEPYDPNCPSGHFHSGIDLAGPWGAPVHAADSGTIYLNYSSYGYGMHIIEIDDNGWVTLYGHLSSFNVGDGTHVSRGDIIGFEGSTGNSTGPHLHFEVRINGSPVNPLAYLP